MKKHLFLLLILFMGFSASLKADLTPEQQQLQNEIVEFLKEEGYAPSIDSDGDILFKSEGHKFYIIITRGDINPMFITFTTPSYSYTGDFTKENLHKCYAEACLKKGVKLTLFEKTYTYSGEMYLNDAEVFKYSFNKLLSQMQALMKAVSDAVSE